METLTSMFKEHTQKALSLSKVSAVITEDNVYQEGDKNILPLLDDMVDTLILPGSGVDGMENLEDLMAKAESGKSCLLLLEHYSNMDLSIFSLLVRRAKGRGEDIANSLIAIAGMKLNEDNPEVAAYASAYTRIVIYPSRALHGMDEEIKKIEVPRSIGINRAAMKALENYKTKGRLVLIFPSGTRYRSWDPKTKKGVREIDSYIRSFDYMCCVAINGKVLHVQQSDMMNDFVGNDIVRITVGQVMRCDEFRAKARAEAREAGIEDKKQFSVDAIMAELEKMHNTAEEKRQKLIQELQEKKNDNN